MNGETLEGAGERSIQTQAQGLDILNVEEELLLAVPQKR